MALRLVIGNWKMQLTVREAVHLALTLRHSRLASQARLVLCPSFTALSAVSRVLHGSPIELGAQNLAPVANGAMTGEVSASDLKILGCRFVIVGHSDRRALGETDAQIRQKVRQALASGLTPVLCVGERRAERRPGQARPVVRGQVQSAVSGLPPAQRRRVRITYEPVWAISPGGPVTPPQAFAMAEVIWQSLGGQASPLIYGGSVTPSNINAFLDGTHFSGVLVGQASLTARSLISLVNG